MRIGKWAQKPNNSSRICDFDIQQKQQQQQKTITGWEMFGMSLFWNSIKPAQFLVAFSICISTATATMIATAQPLPLPLPPRPCRSRRHRVERNRKRAVEMRNWIFSQFHTLNSTCNEIQKHCTICKLARKFEFNWSLLARKNVFVGRFSGGAKITTYYNTTIEAKCFQLNHPFFGMNHTWWAMINFFWLVNEIQQLKEIEIKEKKITDIHIQISVETV